MAFLDETGLAELWSLVRGADVKIAAGSYTGTGTYGASNPCSLTFDFVPKFLFIDLSHFANTTNHYSNFTWVKGMATVNVVNHMKSSINASINNVTLSGTTLSWYNDSNEKYQANASTIYYYIAIG